MHGVKEHEESPVLFPFTPSSDSRTHNQVLGKVGTDVPYLALKAMAMQKDQSRVWSSGTLMAASPSYFPRITEMLVPGSWGENCAYINLSGKETESSQVVLLEKNQKPFWLQL